MNEYYAFVNNENSENEIQWWDINDSDIYNYSSDSSDIDYNNIDYNNIDYSNFIITSNFPVKGSIFPVILPSDFIGIKIDI
jgi:hypothetical protein